MVLANLQLETVVTNLLEAADKACKGLEKEEDWKAYWSVNYDLVRALQGLDLFGKQEKPIEPSVMRDQVQIEVAALVDLELKRRKREEEMLQMHRGAG